MHSRVILINIYFRFLPPFRSMENIMKMIFIFDSFARDHLLLRFSMHLFTIEIKLEIMTFAIHPSIFNSIMDGRTYIKMAQHRQWFCPQQRINSFRQRPMSCFISVSIEKEHKQKERTVTMWSKHDSHFGQYILFID